MNGERPQVNGQHILNGATSTQHHQATEAKIARSSTPVVPQPTKSEAVRPYVNGVHQQESNTSKHRALPNGIQQLPPEILQLVPTEHYIPVATLINRRTQLTWARLSDLVDNLFSFDVPLHNARPGQPVRNTSKQNQDKKQKILEFVQGQRDDFIKQLILLNWGKNSERVSQTISLNTWIAQRRAKYWNVTAALAQLTRDAVGFQIPNPDITTAGEILSKGKVSAFPDIGYAPVKTLTTKDVLQVIKRLNRTLCLRLSLMQELPPRFRNFDIHDGRATFSVPGEFEVDLSVLDESLESPFKVVDFRFLFRPRPAVPDGLRASLEDWLNTEIESKGLDGCYNLLHELTLSNKVIELHKQALDLLHGQQAGQTRVELLRRNLTVQYWSKSKVAKSWIELGINKGSPDSAPCLAFRWFREGKRVQDYELDLDLGYLSLRSILTQIIAQHSTHMLANMYDRLSSVPLFDQGVLEIEQTSSYSSTEDCSLTVEICQGREISFMVDAATGAIRISPASDRTQRLEAELNRSNSALQDFVPRLLNFRCATVEAAVQEAITETAWERLTTFRPSSAEIRAVIGPSVNRISFFRHPTWRKEYLLTIAHHAEQDELCILQQGLQDGIVSFTGARIVHREALPAGGRLDPEFFENLTIQASLIVISHANASKLQTLSWSFEVAKVNDLEERSNLDVLTFKIKSEDNATSGVQSAKTWTSVHMRLTSLNIPGATAEHSTIVSTKADVDVLIQLAESNTDNRITFLPVTQQIQFQLSAPAGAVLIDDIVSQVRRINDLTACIQCVRKVKTMTLAAVSTKKMIVNYEAGTIKDLSMNIHLPGIDEQPKISFMPADINPHVLLTDSISRLLNDSGKSFASNLEDAISCLTLTGPLLTSFRDIEQSLTSVPANSSASKSGKVRVHVLPRQPTMFAMQFFPQKKGEGSVDAEPSQPLARFEILPASDEKTAWLLRPAMAEFQTYKRSSFMSNALESLVRKEVFTKTTQDWQRLDSAAVCLIDKPGPLLDAIKKVIVDWVEKGEQAPPPPKPVQAPAAPQTPAQPAQKAPQKASTQTTNVNTNAGKPMQKSGLLRQPNGVNAQQQRGRPAQSKGPPKNKEVITLD